MIFKEGDKVRDKSTKDEGVIEESHTYPFRFWNVRMNKNKDIWEYHKGELEKVKEDE